MCRSGKKRGRPKEWRRRADLKRINIGNFRLPRRWVEWLRAQNESGGKLIEKALDKTYKIKFDNE